MLSFHLLPNQFLALLNCSLSGGHSCPVVRLPTPHSFNNCNAPCHFRGGDLVEQSLSDLPSSGIGHKQGWYHVYMVLYACKNHVSPSTSHENFTPSQFGPCHGPCHAVPGSASQASPRRSGKDSAPNKLRRWSMGTATSWAMGTAAMAGPWHPVMAMGRGSPAFEATDGCSTVDWFRLYDFQISIDFLIVLSLLSYTKGPNAFLRPFGKKSMAACLVLGQWVRPSKEIPAPVLVLGGCLERQKLFPHCVLGQVTPRIETGGSRWSDLPVKLRKTMPHCLMSAQPKNTSQNPPAKDPAWRVVGSFCSSKWRGKVQALVPGHPMRARRLYLSCKQRMTLFGGWSRWYATMRLDLLHCLFHDGAVMPHQVTSHAGSTWTNPKTSENIKTVTDVCCVMRGCKKNMTISPAPVRSPGVNSAGKYWSGNLHIVSWLVLTDILHDPFKHVPLPSSDLWRCPTTLTTWPSVSWHHRQYSDLHHQDP